MLERFLDTFVVLFVVVDPIGLAPIYAALTHGATEAYARRMAVRGILIAAVLLVVFVLAGAWLLRALGISLPAFQIAGGILLFLVALDMVFVHHSGIRSTTESERREAQTRADISVFPLAFPLVAGPGALTTVLLLAGRYGEAPFGGMGLLAVLAVVLLLTLVSLLHAPRIMRWLGETGANVVTRVFGVILTALAVQYVLDGLGAGLR